MSKTRKTKRARWTDRLDRDAVREALEDACVDAYDEYEQHTGLLTMIENDLRFPFPAKVLGEDSACCSSTAISSRPARSTSRPGPSGP